MSNSKLVTRYNNDFIIFDVSIPLVIQFLIVDSLLSSETYLTLMICGNNLKATKSFLLLLLVESNIDCRLTFFLCIYPKVKVELSLFIFHFSLTPECFTTCGKSSALNAIETTKSTFRIQKIHIF